MPERPFEEVVDLLADFRRLARAQDWPAAIDAVGAMLMRVRRRIALAAAPASAAVPAESARIAARQPEPDVALPREAPMHLFGAATPSQVLEHWRRQLADTTTAVTQLIDGDFPRTGQWFQDWTEGTPQLLPFYRAEALRDYLNELRKLATLMHVPQHIVRLSAGEVIVADTGPGLGAWECHGGEVQRQGGSVQVAGSGNALWFQHDIPDHALIRFVFTPEPMAEERGGVLFAWCAAPRTASAFAASAGPMAHYNDGIDTYHVSLARGQSGVTNLRRTGRGLRMLSSGPDPCARRGRASVVELLTCGRTVQVHVDGQLQHHYLDAGAHGEPRTRGRFGLRLFAGPPMRLSISDLRVQRLVSTIVD